MAEDVLQLLGAQIRTRRFLAGMTQNDLADEVGMTRTSIANMEAGRQNPGYSVLVKIAAGLGVTVAELVATEVSSDLPAEFDALALYRRLDAHREAEGLSWRAVAARTSVAAPTFTNLSNGQPLSADCLLRVLLWLGDTDIEPYAKRAPLSPSTPKDQQP